MPKPIRTDVVVVGAGNAALVAALAAHEQGARVIVLEAAPHAERGGNSRFSGGIFRFVHDGLDHIAPLLTSDSHNDAEQVEVGPYPAARYREDLMGTSANRSDPVLVDTLVERSYEIVAWMRDQGVRWELTVGKLHDPDNLDAGQTYVLPPGGAVRAAGEGVGLVADLFAAVEAAGIDVWYDAPVESLLLTGSTVHGVRVRRVDDVIDVHGAVVLASGGFEANAEMRRRHLGPGWDLVKVRGTRFNTGTLLSEALKAGAQPAGHWDGCHASPQDADAPAVGELSMTDKMSRYSYPYGILVNLDGERFVDEGEDEVWLTYAKTGSAIREQPEALAFQIFDRKTVHLLEPRYTTGTPVVAGSVGELADSLGIRSPSLTATVDRYNAATMEGDFDPLHKDGLATHASLHPGKSNWALPVNDPPFTAYRVTCGITFTYGGLKIDTEGRVLDSEGLPMPGLFATGEITGGFFYHNYPAGAGLVRGAVFGRIAGANAAFNARPRPTAAPTC
ncbi:MAG: FAD-dependent tricarballylate dehydrogenase TcuA [Nocardioidaceae bacterium]